MKKENGIFPRHFSSFHSHFFLVAIISIPFRMEQTEIQSLFFYSAMIAIIVGASAKEGRRKKHEANRTQENPGWMKLKWAQSASTQKRLDGESCEWDGKWIDRTPSRFYWRLVFSSTRIVINSSYSWHTHLAPVYFGLSLSLSTSLLPGSFRIENSLSHFYPAVRLFFRFLSTCYTIQYRSIISHHKLDPFSLTYLAFILFGARLFSFHSVKFPIREHFSEQISSHLKIFVFDGRERCEMRRFLSYVFLHIRLNFSCLSFSETFHSFHSFLIIWYWKW